MWPPAAPTYSIPVSEVYPEEWYDRIAHKEVSKAQRFNRTNNLPAVPSKDVSADVWYHGTTYVWPVTQSAMRISSTSAADDDGGAGVNSVYVVYLDNTYAQKAETITLNGTAAVTTAGTDIFRINNFRAFSVGTGASAAGTISLYHLSSAVTYKVMAIGNTRARESIYTVPLGKELYLTSLFASAAYTSVGKSERLTLRATYDDASDVVLAPNFFMPFAEVLLMDSAIQRDFRIPMRFPTGTDMKISVIGEASAQVETSMRGYLYTP
jgi:hypothetical protein